MWYKINDSFNYRVNSSIQQLYNTNRNLLHGIKSDIKGILSWMKKEPKKDVLMKTLKVMETSGKKRTKERCSYENAESDGNNPARKNLNYSFESSRQPQN
jgi:hypothetical protein